MCAQCVRASHAGPWPSPGRLLGTETCREEEGRCASTGPAKHTCHSCRLWPASAFDPEWLDLTGIESAEGCSAWAAEPARAAEAETRNAELAGWAEQLSSSLGAPGAAAAKLESCFLCGSLPVSQRCNSTSGLLGSRCAASTSLHAAHHANHSALLPDGANEMPSPLCPISGEEAPDTAAAKAREFGTPCWLGRTAGLILRGS